jgi:hypothetical protein
VVSLGSRTAAGTSATARTSRVCSSSSWQRCPGPTPEPPATRLGTGGARRHHERLVTFAPLVSAPDLGDDVVSVRSGRRLGLWLSSQSPGCSGWRRRVGFGLGRRFVPFDRTLQRAAAGCVDQVACRSDPADSGRGRDHRRGGRGGASVIRCGGYVLAEPSVHPRAAMRMTRSGLSRAG